MSITHVPDEELLVFDHEIAAPVEDVFGAYMDPELLARWYGPAGWHVRPTDVVLEPMVGGMQRLSMINEVDPSVSCILQSRFLAIEPPNSCPTTWATPAACWCTSVTVSSPRR